MKANGPLGWQTHRERLQIEHGLIFFLLFQPNAGYGRTDRCDKSQGKKSGSS